MSVVEIRRVGNDVVNVLHDPEAWFAPKPVLSGWAEIRQSRLALAEMGAFGEVAISEANQAVEVLTVFLAMYARYRRRSVNTGNSNPDDRFAKDSILDLRNVKAFTATAKSIETVLQRVMED